MQKFSLLFAGAALGSLATYGALRGDMRPFVLEAHAAAADTYRQLNLFGDVFERVRAEYVEEPNDEQLVETAINGMLTALDPHSSYLNPKDFKAMQVQTKGEFGGIGIEMVMENGLVKVVTPIDDTPAAKAGILAGDLVVQIDEDAVAGMTQQQAVDKMRGPVGSEVKLKIQRSGKEEALEIKLKRDIIKVSSVRARDEGGDVGYIRITQFNEKTTEGVRNAIAGFQKSMGDKMKGLVVDLRNDPGGLLDQAIGVSDVFLERGEIVSTRGRNPDDAARYVAKGGDDAKGKPVIVLVNGGSASASEIVAGALQDHKRATLLGTRSFGKGSVQTIMPLVQQGGAIRLTTARYYTPSGRSIQAKGIEPDIVVQPELPDELKGKTTLGESSLKGHLKTEGDGGEGNGSSAYIPPDPKDDKQLNQALDLLRGKAQNPAFPPNPKQAAVKN